MSDTAFTKNPIYKEKAEKFSQIASCNKKLIYLESAANISLDDHKTVFKLLGNKLKATCESLVPQSRTFIVSLHLTDFTTSQETRDAKFADGGGHISMTIDDIDQIVDFLKDNHLNNKLRKDITRLEDELLENHNVKAIRSRLTDEMRLNLREYQQALEEELEYYKTSGKKLNKEKKVYLYHNN